MDITRRHFFSRASTGIGIAALGSLLAQDGRWILVGARRRQHANTAERCQRPSGLVRRDCSATTEGDERNA